MDAKEKLALIDRIICESFEWGVDVCENNGFLQGVISAISSIVNSGKEEEKEEEAETCRNCEFGFSRDDAFGHFTYCLDKKVVVDPNRGCEKWRERKTDAIDCSYNCKCRSCRKVRECFFSRCLQCDEGSKATRACVDWCEKEEE